MDINSAWKSACKVLLGEEIGEIQQYAGYLQKYVEPLSEKTSALSGKKVLVSSSDFCKGAKFICNEEREAYAKMLAQHKIGINDMKDIDSMLGALSESLYYCGNIVLGNSAFVQESNRCVNAYYCFRCDDVYDSKYVAYSREARYCEYVFGSNQPGESKFNIKGMGVWRAVRCMEVMRAMACSDCYYSANIEDCSDCMFSFNLRSKRRMIGNNSLSKEEYEKLKAKLIWDMCETLSRKKVLPYIADIIAGGQLAGTEKSQQLPPSEPSEEIEKAFGQTSRVLFGKPLSNMRAYGKWLQQHVPKYEKVRSAISAQPVCIPAWVFYKPARAKCVTIEESLELGKKCVLASRLEKLGVSSAAALLKEISFIAPDIRVSNNFNITDVATCGYTSDCAYCSVCAFSKHCAYSYWPRQSEHIFGSSLAFSSQFCLKCYHSSSLSRCFEVSDSYSCSDCYFCHNCENLSDCMFCFNAKNLRYAIGNVEVGREEFLRVKGILLAHIQKELEEKKKLELGIFNIGEKK